MRGFLWITDILPRPPRRSGHGIRQKARRPLPAIRAAEGTRSRIPPVEGPLRRAGSKRAIRRSGRPPPSIHRDGERHRSIHRGSVPQQSTRKDGARHRSIRRGSARRQSTRKRGAPHRSIRRGSAPQQSIRKRGERRQMIRGDGGRPPLPHLEGAPQAVRRKLPAIHARTTGTAGHAPPRPVRHESAKKRSACWRR